MSSFELNARFDVVACVFDSLNHLTEFPRWVDTIERAAAHLLPGGLFIVDVNTLGRLEVLSRRPAHVVDFNGSTLVMGVANEGEGLATWDIRVFERALDGRYDLTHEQVRELAVDLDLVRGALSASFETLSEDDGTGARPSNEAERAHFVCRRR